MKKILLFAISVLFSVYSVFALNITATQSGNWSDGNTWVGGVSPGTTLNIKDVIIPVGITVTLDVDVSVTLNRMIQVDGTLAGPDHLIDLSGGNLEGSGNVELDSLTCGFSSNITLGATGSLIVNVLSNQANIINLSQGNYEIRESLNLRAGWLRMTGTSLLALSDTCWINMRGGRITNLTSNDITAALNVRLSDDADTLKNELSLINNVFGNIVFDFDDSTQIVILGEDIVVNGEFNLASGILNLDGNTVEIAGNFIADHGRFHGTVASGLSFTGYGILDTLRFEQGFEYLGTLAVDRDTNLILGNDLSIATLLDFSGEELVIGGNHLNVAGTFVLDSASITGSTLSFLTLGGSGNIDTLVFTPGASMLAEFFINRTGGNSLVLGSDLQILDQLALTNGTIALGGNNLNIDGHFIRTNGFLAGGEGSSLFVGGSGMFDPLAFAPGTGQLDSLGFTRGTALELASDLMVDSTFDFNGSELQLGNYALEIGNDFSLNGAPIFGGDSAGLFFTGHGLIDTLEFDPSAATLGEFSIDLDTLKAVILGSDIEIKGTVFMVSGEMVLNGTTLTISGTIEKNKGLFVGSASGSMIIEGVDSTGLFAFKEGFEFLNNLTIDRTGIGSNGLPGGIIGLTSNLNVNNLRVLNGMLNLPATSNGAKSGLMSELNLTINQVLEIANGAIGNYVDVPTGLEIPVNIILNGDLETTPNGEIVGSELLSLFVQGSGSMDTLVMNAIYNELSALVYDNMQTLVFGGDIVINDTLHIYNSTVDLGFGTLTINGDLILEDAVFSASELASLIINGPGSIDTLQFDPSTSEINNFTINVDSGHTIVIGCNLIINGTLYLFEGELVLDNDTLILMAGVSNAEGTITGAVDATLILAGTYAPTILAFTEGAQELKELVLDRADGVITMGSDLTIDSVLTLVQGYVDLAGNSIFLDSLANIAGGWAGSYIVTSDSGQVVIPAWPGDEITFPVGTFASYAPAVLEILGASDEGNFALNVYDGVFEDGNIGALLSDSLDVVMQTWNFETDAINPAANLTVEWDPSAEANNFNNDSCYISHFDGTEWDTFTYGSATPTDSGTFSINRD
ncbi:MAG: hypothetical protein KKA07_15155, partial [Bacteroidetes bacterium]|nr:hypothetical protein [Bacteroidota bacterium]